MCHLVSFFDPPAYSGLNILKTEVFDSEDSAKSSAADRLKSGCREVRVWKLVASPILVPTVQWS